MKANLFIQIFSGFIIIASFACNNLKNATGKGMMSTSPITDSIYIKLDRHLIRQVAKGFKGEVYLVRNGTVILNKSYGQKETTKRMAYWIASNAKAVTALAIQKLEEDKKLSIQDHITKYFSNVSADKQHITIHQLLTHSSGYPQKYVTDNIQTYQKAFEALMSIPIKKEDIGKYEYSNDGYGVLVLLVEKLSGKTYEEYVTKEIFKPANLKHTGFWGYEKDNVVIAPPFDSARAAKQPVTMFKDGMSVVNYGQKGPSGIYSTAVDQYKLFKAMMDVKIISKANLAKGFKPYVLVSQNEDMKTYYAYGWLVGYKDDQLINIRHTGEETWLGHNSMRIGYPNGDVISVLSNSHLTKEEDVWAVQVAYDIEYLLQSFK